MRSPDVARLSDEEETRLAHGPRVDAAAPSASAAKAYLRLRGHEGGCVAIVGFEGEADEVERRHLRTSALLRGGGGLRLGRRPGEAWLRTRYAGPYLRDELLDRGVLVETLETATGWSNLARLYGAVADALHDTLAGRGTPPLVMCHVSHLYRSGASLYFTFLARQEAEAPLDQWRAAKIGGERGDHGRRAARSPTTTPSAATTSRGCAPRSATSVSSCCAPPRSASTRPGS